MGALKLGGASISLPANAFDHILHLAYIICSTVCQGLYPRYPEVSERKAPSRPPGMAHAWPPVLP